uniref:Uncharacterized protein n=1 Tax=Ovis aries TaxID=9940 RepID=A0AC11CW42_SHEEP
MPCLPSPHTVGCSPRTLLQTEELQQVPVRVLKGAPQQPYPLEHVHCSMYRSHGCFLTWFLRRQNSGRWIIEDPAVMYVLFIIARTWKQPRCPSADEWIRKLWYVYTVEYYSAIKKNTLESVLMRWMKLEPIIQSEVSQKENTTTVY